MICRRAGLKTISILAFFLFASFVKSQNTVHLFKVDKEQELQWKALRSKSSIRIVNYDPRVYNTLKDERPALLNMAIPTNDGDIELELIENHVLKEGFKLSTDKKDNVPYTPGLYYKGKIKGKENSFVAISLFDNEVMGVFSEKDKSQLVIGKAKNLRSNSFMIISESDMDNPGFTCNAEDKLPEWPQRVKVLNDGLRSKQAAKCVDVYIEAGYSVYNANGKTESSAANFISGIFNGTSSLYSNESVATSLSQIKVWTSQEPYSSGLGYGTTIGTNFNGDLAHYITMAVGSGAAGVAYLPGVCGSPYAYSELFSSGAAYPSYSWNVNVVTHEMGHNLGSAHTQSCTWPGGPIDGCVAPEGGCSTKGPIPGQGGGTIMSYCHQIASIGINFANGFGPLPGNKIRETVNTASCLGACGTSGGGGTPITTSPPDLQTISVTISPSTITAANQQFNIACNTANFGGSSNAFTSRIYFSNDNSVSSDDQVVTDINIPSLPASSSASSNFNLSLNGSVSSGTYYFIVCADYNNQIAESNENNNCKTATLTIDISTTPTTPTPPTNPTTPATPPPTVTIPDLAVTISTNIPSVINAGSSFTISGAVSNLGSGIAPATTVRAVLSTDQVISGSDLTMFSNDMASLGAGASSSFSNDISIPFTVPTSMYLLICVDPSNFINESNENNNCKIYLLNINILKPDLSISDVRLSQTLVPTGTPFSVNFKTNNTGGSPAGSTSTSSVYLSTDATFSQNDQKLAEVNVAALANSTSQADVVNISTPINQGSYYIIVCADSKNTVTEASETNNCSSVALEITNPVPDMVVDMLNLPTAFLVGESQSITLRIKNKGVKKSERGGKGILKIGLSENGTGEKSICEFGFPVLDVNESYDTIIHYVVEDATGAGNQYFTACADITNVITESIESNNCSTQLVNIIVPIADLKNITAVSYKDPIGRGAKFSLPFTMVNIGTKVADSVNVEYYLSYKPLLKSSGVVKLLYDTIREKIVPGDTLKKTVKLALPGWATAGSYYMNVCINFDNRLKESTTINNCQSMRFIIRNPLPDLIISKFELLDSTLIPGVPASIKLAISNIGELTAPKSEVRSWYSSGSSLDSSQLLNLTIDSLPIDSTIDAIIHFTPGVNTIDSSLLFEAVVDINNDIKEGNENNNSSSFEIKSSPTQPDINLANLYIRDSIWTSEENFSIIYSLNNFGFQRASNFEITYSIKNDTGEQVFTSQKSITRLDAESSKKDTSSIKLPIAIVSGVYTLEINADSKNTVSEFDENNNNVIGRINFVQKQPDISLVSFILPDTILKGSLDTARLKIANYGTWPTQAIVDTIVLSTDQTLSADDYRIAVLKLPVLNSKETKDFTLPLQMPAQIATGGYFILLSLDRNNVLIESNENNNSQIIGVQIPNNKIDLKHAGLALPHGDMYQGDTIIVDQMITNIGETKAGKFDISITLKKEVQDQVPAFEYLLLNQGSGISPDEMVELNSTLRLPDTIAPGTYYLISCIDPFGKINEMTKSNNCGQVLVQISRKAGFSTGLASKPIFSKVVMFPNPASNWLEVSGNLLYTNDNLHIGIKDYTGRNILAQKLTSSSSLNYKMDISQLHAGWYVLEIYSAKGSWRQPFLKF